MKNIQGKLDFHLTCLRTGGASARGFLLSKLRANCYNLGYFADILFVGVHQ